MGPHHLDRAGGSDREPADLYLAFIILAHITLVRASLTVPPKCRGFGKCDGADGLVSTTVSSSLPWWLRR